LIELLFTSPDDFYQRNPRFAIVETMVHAFGDCGMLVLYPPFLAAALNTRWTRPFAGKRMRVGTALCAALLYAGLFWPLATALRTSAAPDFQLLALPTGILYAALVARFVFAFAASLRVWSVSTGAARKRARIFAVAFGIRDVCWGFLYRDTGLGAVEGRLCRCLHRNTALVHRLSARHVHCGAADRLRHPAHAVVRHRPAHPLDDQAVDAGRSRRSAGLRVVGRCAVSFVVSLPSRCVSAPPRTEVFKSFRAHAISVDVSARAIRFRVPDDATAPKWSEVAATRDDATVWKQAPEKIYKTTSAKADLAATLKKNTKAYVGVTDRGSNSEHWWMEKLTTMPAGSTIP
jgi:hypothetical protein